MSDGLDSVTPTIPSQHAQFNAADSDVIVESSDLTSFKIHRRNLEAHTGLFPLPENVEASAIPKIYLPEPASTLEVVFEYVYPKKQGYYPYLENMEFEELMAIADAVEKYKVFSAMHLCVDNDFSYPLEIFLHAIKYCSPVLINEAAPYVAFNPSLEVIEQIPASAALPWVKYREAVLNVTFDSAVTYLKALLKTQPNTPKQNGCKIILSDDSGTNQVFPKCQGSVTVWLGYLRGCLNFAELEKELDSTSQKSYLALCSYGACPLLNHIAGCCKKGLQEAKLIKFTTFLDNDEAEL